jgi:hypothetical protein
MNSTMSNPKEAVARTTTHTSSDDSNVDEAWKYLNTHTTTTTAINNVDIAKLRRKIDWHIVPIMFACYTMQFLDKVILNYAAVMGLQKDLHLKGNEFSNVATFLFVGLLCFEIPNSTSCRPPYTIPLSLNTHHLLLLSHENLLTTM